MWERGTKATRGRGGGDFGGREGTLIDQFSVFHDASTDLLDGPFFLPSIKNGESEKTLPVMLRQWIVDDC